MVKIGLEIHCQITSLNSKLFCSCDSKYMDHLPNSNTCPICLGQPGTLPLLNKQAVWAALSISQALHCTTPKKIAFFRKNYFYPDLPKNYQITQLNIYGDTSIGVKGYLNAGHKVRITRIQLEEDPGRLIYEGASERTKIPMVDYNRSGVALVEIVTEPDMQTPAQARLFLNTLSDLLKNLQVSDPTLKGAMRADGNVSVEGGSKVEIKNVGSFHDLEKALNYEITRQENLLVNNNNVPQETRHWDDRRKITVSARSKEDDLDYRYFLENDIPWVLLDDKLIKEIKSSMPETFETRLLRYTKQYGINPQVANVLVSDRYFYELFEESSTLDNGKDLANLITTDLMGMLDSKEAQQNSKLTSQNLRHLLDALVDKKISKQSAKKALTEMVKNDAPLDVILHESNLIGDMDDDSLLKIIQSVIEKQPDVVKSLKENPQAINFLVGQVMKETQGKADPTSTLALIKKTLSL